MLTIRGLNQYYGGSHILRGIDLEVPAGACTALLGRNGVGKTTLLRCLMGEVPVRSGTLLLEGEDVTALPPWERARRGLGYVPQGREIFSRLTVAENLLVGEAAAGTGSVTSRDELEELFPILRTMQRRRGGDLSGGQQQQLAIARALVTQPRLLILDEPTEGIQPSIIKQIEGVIRTLAARGTMAILLVEQYLDFARELADNFAILERDERSAALVVSLQGSAYLISGAETNQILSRWIRDRTTPVMVLGPQRWEFRRRVRDQVPP